MAPRDEYAHPEILAETDWLSRRLDNPAVRVIDARGPAQYREGHIPGAVNISGMEMADPETLELHGPDAFARIMGEKGIGSSHIIVCYDESGPPAARLWWALTYYGHPRVRFLNGGFVKWAYEQRPLTREVPSHPHATFEPSVLEGLKCTLDQAKVCVDSPEILLWDVRSRREYTGEEPRDNPPGRVGHLPGAVHLEWSDLVDPESRTIKPAGEVRALLAARGITLEREIVTY